MASSSRLKEIAESNKPAFSSTTGVEWWLAEAPSVHESAPAAAQEKQPEATELKRDIVTTAKTLVQRTFANA
jgi:hypothetical protein